MIRGELNRPIEPREGSTAGPVSGVWQVDHRWRSIVVGTLIGLLILATGRDAQAGKPRILPEGPVTEIRTQGNQSITPEQIKSHIKSRVGRPLDQAVLDDDLKALNGTKWFSEVQIVYEQSADGKGVVLIVIVAEMPIIHVLEFIGIHKLKLKDIQEACDLKKGGRADWKTTQMAPNRIKAVYEEKGYEQARVKLLEGGNPGDTKIVIEIFEGPKFHIESIDFVGNTFVDDALLKTKIDSRKGILGTLGEKRYKDSLENDRRNLIKFYQENGFFMVEVSATVKPGADIGAERITYTISEKTRFKVRKIVFEGNTMFPEAALKQGLLMKENEPYNEKIRELDYAKIMKQYQEKGCIKTTIEKDQLDTNQPDLIDVVYRINEGTPVYLGQLIIKGNVHTKDKVFRREALMAGLLPGEVLDMTRLEKYQQRVIGTGYVAKPGQPGAAGKGLNIEIVHQRSGDKPYGEDVAVDPESILPGLGRMQSPDDRSDDLPPLPATPPQLAPLSLGGPSLIRKQPSVVPPAVAAAALANRQAQATQARMQSGEPALQLPGDPVALPPLTIGPGQATAGSAVTAAPLPTGPGAVPPQVDGSGISTLSPFGRQTGVFDPQPNVVPSLPLDPLPPVANGENPGPNNKVPNSGGPVDRGDRNPGLFPSLPNQNMNNVGPDRQEPFGHRDFADIVTQIDEAPTGRIMFGVGASSQAGLNGNVILHESNFDLFAVPRSMAELMSGRAFRGAGQEFRIELSPGTQINRYVISFRDPYLFDLPIGLGLNGYQWSRFYPDWNERRSGGRFSLGYQAGPQMYTDVAVRAENVNIAGFKYPAAADILAAAGSTFLATIRPSIRFDNRNNPTSPSTGSYLEAAFEQGFGTFTFPKITLEGRQHFTLGSRPDGSGKRTLALRGFFGATGRDTPVYERFFAGDFRSMRGFYYRGVGPHIEGQNVGGVLTAIGSVEYQFPWNASDTLQQVVFCDFGTVEADYKFTTIRAAVGTGVRVVIPQITGQLPLAFDLAFPVAKADGDRVRYFSFFIGAFW